MRYVMLVACLVMIGQTVFSQAPRVISYQGFLSDTTGTAMVDAVYNLTFRLYNAQSGGTPLWTEADPVQTKNGIFGTMLGSVTPFPDSLLFNRQYWLGITLNLNPEFSPRVQWGTVPYSMRANRADTAYVSRALANGSTSLVAENVYWPNAILSVDLISGTGAAIIGSSTVGVAGVYGTSQYASGAGVEGVGNGFNAAGVYGLNGSGPGVWGRGTAGNTIGVFGEVQGSGGKGVWGVENFASGIGVFGQADDGSSIGVEGSSVNGQGVYGWSGNTYGVQGHSVNGRAIYGESETTIGIHGVSTATGTSGTGVLGESNYIGVKGSSYSSNANRIAVGGENFGASTGYAGYFNGNVHVTGTLFKQAGSFKIDHPLDPANKYLSHSFVESPDMMNIYNGVIVTDASGSATVTLPEWFQALNADFRYQLTCIGQFAQAIVSREIAGNSFDIRTDKPDVKVSWQVTGIRHDAYAEQNRIKVEEMKPAVERGRYVYPQGFGQGLDRSIGTSILSTTASTKPIAPKNKNEDPPLRTDVPMVRTGGQESK